MSDLLFDEINDSTIVVAPERSKRPRDEFNSQHDTQKKCPFCLGNEGLTPPQSFSVRGASQPWTIRTFPNKYPAFVKNITNVHLSGIQEVLVETEEHKKKPDQYTIDQLKKILEAYKQRIEYFKDGEKTKYILVFKNYGQQAGATLEHQHSQIVALDSIPKRVLKKNIKLEEFFLKHKKCYYCDLYRNSNLVHENKSFFCVMPNDAKFSYECLIIPKMHNPYYERSLNHIFYDLADIILKTIRSTNSLLDFPSFNLILNNGVYLNSFNTLSFHWHFQFIPRVNYLAGFEFATGIYIRPVDHERAAGQLRDLILNN